MAVLKVLLLGGKGVGQSNLMRRLKINEFTPNFPTTIGLDFTHIVQDGENKLQLLDPAGDERFHFLKYGILNGISCVVLVYDQTNVESLQSLGQWITFAREKNPGKQVKFILVGTKADLPSQVKPEDIDAFRQSNHLSHDVPQFETSAKNGSGIQAVKDKLLKYSSTVLEQDCHKKDCPEIQQIERMHRRITNYVSLLQALYDLNPSNPSWSDHPLAENLRKLLRLLESKTDKHWSQEEKNTWKVIHDSLVAESQTAFNKAQYSSGKQVRQILTSIVLTIGAILLSCTLIGLWVTVPLLMKNYQETGSPFRFHRTPKEHAARLLREIEDDLKTIGLELAANGQALTA